jgi:hypothetical protein
MHKKSAAIRLHSFTNRLSTGRFTLPVSEGLFNLVYHRPASGADGLRGPLRRVAVDSRIPIVGPLRLLPRISVVGVRHAGIRYLYGSYPHLVCGDLESHILGSDALRKCGSLSSNR